MPIAAGKPFSPRPDLRARMGSDRALRRRMELIMLAEDAYSMVRGHAGGCHKLDAPIGVN